MATDPSLEEQTAQLKKQTDLLTQQLAELKAQLDLTTATQTKELKSRTDILTQQLATLKAQADLNTALQTQESKSKTDILTQQLAQLKAQADLNTALQTMDAKSAKALFDALKDQTTSQYGLESAQAQLPFAELQGIKAGIANLSLPSGKEGTITVASGTAGTVLLRSKGPMIKVLEEVAGKLSTVCPEGAVLLTETQLAQAYTAKFTLGRIKDEKKKLTEAIANTQITDNRRAVLVPGAAAIGIPALIAGAYTLGFTLDTINSLFKILRTNRALQVFGSDAEALQLLGYLLEAKQKNFVANPLILDDKIIPEAGSLLNELRELAQKVQEANDHFAKLKKYSDDRVKASASDPIITQVQMPDDQNVSLLKAEIEGATVLLDSVNPSKKPDAFWVQVNGQFLSAKIEGMQRLAIEVKAQTIQITESRWYASDRILATGEVLVVYRLFGKDGSLQTSGIILKASSTDGAAINGLEKLDLSWEGKKQAVSEEEEQTLSIVIDTNRVG